MSSASVPKPPEQALEEIKGKINRAKGINVTVDLQVWTKKGLKLVTRTRTIPRKGRILALGVEEQGEDVQLGPDGKPPIVVWLGFIDENSAGEIFFRSEAGSKCEETVGKVHYKDGRDSMTVVEP